MTSRKISVIGLGYVGLPIAVAFGRQEHVVGFDINQKRLEELKKGEDRTKEIESADLLAANILFTECWEDLKTADFHIVTVPTPVNDVNQPDLTALQKASETIGRALKKGDIVVYESTVYPGATEEVCIPILEKISGLKFGTDFTVGYSPERINPGDKQHTFASICKVVSASDAKTLNIVSEVYGSVVKAGIHKAASIKVAEAAKVIENTQRDLNIALMNEIAILFHRLGIDTLDVLEAAKTKWNFLPFQPGLVGGHCVGVDPYYLTHKAEQVGYHPEVILAGRRINNSMGQFIAYKMLQYLIHAAVNPVQATITVMGLTFKENCPDIRNTKVVDIIHELKSFNMQTQICDPLVFPDEAWHEYEVELTSVADLKKADAIILAVPHNEIKNLMTTDLTKLLKPKGIIIDVKGALDRESVRSAGFEIWRL